MALVFMAFVPVTGNHNGDPIVKGRLVSAESSTIHDPEMDELEIWFQKNQQHLPALRRISFRQLCFSFAREGAGAQDAAARGFRKISGQPVDSDAGVANLADHLLLSSYFGDQTPEQVAKVFGAIFARPLFQLKPGSWQGPLESELGWHLVWIDSITSGPVPTVARALALPGETR